jgi:DNA invertase Pin-like site-specific DNA recombinase
VTTAKPLARYSAGGARSRAALLPPSYTISWDTTKHDDLDLDEKLSFMDLGISAYRGRNGVRGSLADFRFAVEKGEVPPGSFLLVESFDRISRMDPWEAMPVFQQNINAGITIVTLQDEKTWSRETIRGNPLRILESLFVMIRAHEESATKSRRLLAVYEQKRKRAATKADTKPFTRCLPACACLAHPLRARPALRAMG